MRPVEEQAVLGMVGGLPVPEGQVGLGNIGHFQRLLRQVHHSSSSASKFPRVDTSCSSSSSDITSGSIVVTGDVTSIGVASSRNEAEPDNRISIDRKSTRLNSSHHSISYAVF